MTRNQTGTSDALLAAVFSDEPAPEIHAAVIVSHAGDECISAAWLLSRLYDRASVFRATSSPHTEAPDAVTLTGLPGERCHSLGLTPGTLGADLEALTWLVSAAVKEVNPRLLVTHAFEGINLDHDAVSFAAHMTALLLPRFGSVAPLVVEFPCHHGGPEIDGPAELRWAQGVRIDFGPDSRQLKEQILRSHIGRQDSINHSSLNCEVYRPSSGGLFQHTPPNLDRGYDDAPSLSVREFWGTANTVAQRFAREGLIAGVAV